MAPDGGLEDFPNLDGQGKTSRLQRQREPSVATKGPTVNREFAPVLVRVRNCVFFCNMRSLTAPNDNIVHDILRLWYIVSVGTLNQGYPLLKYEDTVPIRRSLAAR
jgi:hypothetical protein